MEFDIGTLIYIIITIVAIVAGTMGNKKKPSPRKPGEEGESSSGGFFDKLEEQISGFVDETKQSVRSVTDDIGFTGEDRAEQASSDYSGYDEIMEEYRDDDDETDESEYADFEGVFNPEQDEDLDLIRQEVVRSNESSEALQLIEMDGESYPDYFEIVSDFDLGTAVVYSTIINRIEY